MSGFARAGGAGADAAASGKKPLAREAGEWWSAEDGERAVVAVVVADELVAVLLVARRVVGEGGGGWNEERRRWWDVKMREGVGGARMAGEALGSGLIWSVSLRLDSAVVSDRWEAEGWWAAEEERVMAN